MIRIGWVAAAIVATASVSALALTGCLPLGVAGEWEWGRIESPTTWETYCIATLAALVYAIWVGRAASWIDRGAASRRATLTLMVPAAFIVQVALQLPGYGLAKWPLVLFNPSASGYHTTASAEVRTVQQFLDGYSEFLAAQEPFHLGTHPPGLILMHYAAIRACAESEGLTRLLLSVEPQEVREGFRAIAVGAAVTTVDRASIWLVALVTQFASSLCVIPIFFLARRGAGAQAAWLAVSFWPLVPSVTLFVPNSDVLHALVASAATAAAIGGHSPAGQIARGFAAGVIAWIGLFLSLALLPVLVIVGLTICFTDGLHRDTRWRGAVRLLAIGLGIAAPTVLLFLTTGHNLVATWIACYHKHASFYDVMPRSYWPWVGFNLLEFTVGVGVPLMATAIAGTIRALRKWSTVRRDSQSCDSDCASSTALIAAWWFTLLVLNLTGKNLGEVARLWILLIPFAVPAAAWGIRLVDSRVWLPLALLVAQSFQAVAFSASMQGFYDPSSVRVEQFDPSAPRPTRPRGTPDPQ